MHGTTFGALHGTCINSAKICKAVYLDGIGMQIIITYDDLVKENMIFTNYILKTDIAAATNGCVT